MRLDLSKLAVEPTVQKAVWERDGQIYGTLYTAARSNPRCDLEKSHPDVVEMVMHGERILRLPKSWEYSKNWFSTEWSEAAFVSVCFTVAHGIKFPVRPKIPAQVGYLLSAHLQLGEAFNFRNFANYRRYCGLKFLPFLITREQFQFFIYDPTPDRVKNGISVFQAVLDKLQGLTPLLPEVLRDAYTCVRLDEVQEVSHLIDPVLQDANRRLAQWLQPYRKQFGFVYKDLPGSQDTKLFDYEMYATD